MDEIATAPAGAVVRRLERGRAAAVDAHVTRGGRGRSLDAARRLQHPAARLRRPLRRRRRRLPRLDPRVRPRASATGRRRSSSSPTRSPASTACQPDPIATSGSHCSATRSACSRPNPVYLDGGHSGWHPAATMAARLHAGRDRKRARLRPQRQQLPHDRGRARLRPRDLEHGRAGTSSIDTGRNGLGPAQRRVVQPARPRARPAPAHRHRRPARRRLPVDQAARLLRRTVQRRPGPGRLVAGLRARARLEVAVEIALQRRRHERDDLLGRQARPAAAPARCSAPRSGR